MNPVERPYVADTEFPSDSSAITKASDILSQKVDRRRALTALGTVGIHILANPQGVSANQGSFNRQESLLSNSNSIFFAGDKLATEDNTELANADIAVSEMDSLAAMESSIEATRGIKLNTLYDAIQETGYLFWYETPEQVEGMKRIEWNQERLTLIDEICSFLPEHLYRDEGKPTLHFSLVAEQDTPCDCAGFEFNELENYPLVILVDKYFNPENWDMSVDLVTHEAMHYELIDYKNQPNPFINEAIGMEYSAARQILIMRVASLKKPLIEKKINKGEESITQEEKQKLDFYELMSIGLGAGFYQLPTSDYPDEFVAVLGEVYIKGTTYFKDNLRDIFTDEVEEGEPRLPIDGIETVENLYGYMHSIFGMEFDDSRKKVADSDPQALDASRMDWELAFTLRKEFDITAQTPLKA